MRQTNQWTWKTCSTELNRLGTIDTIYRDLLRRATRGNRWLEEEGISIAAKIISNPFALAVETN